MGLLAIAAVLGAVMAIPVASYSWLWSYLPPWTWSSAFRIWFISLIQAALALVPFLAFLIWLPRHCQHVRWVAAAGATYSLSITLFAFVLADLAYPYNAFDALPYYLPLIPVGPVIGSAMALAACGLQRSFVSQLLEQDGTLCSHCGYPARRSGSVTCPECERACTVIARSRSERLIHWFGFHNRRVLGTLATIVALGYGVVYWTNREHQTLGRTFGEEWTHSRHQVVTGMGSRKRGTATYRPVGTDGGSGVVVVALSHRPSWRKRELSVALGHIVRVSPGGNDLIASGNPAVYVHVPREHQRRLLRHGPPEHIIQRLLQRASEEGWQQDDRWWWVTHAVKVQWDDE
jgi:hypothetical protein